MEKKLLQYCAVALAVVWVLFFMGSIVYSVMAPAVMNSSQELGLIQRMLLSSSSWIKMNVVFLSVSLIAIWGFIFWILMLVDCVRRNFVKDVDKIICFLMILIFNFIGAAFYFYLIKNKKT